MDQPIVPVITEASKIIKQTISSVFKDCLRFDIESRGRLCRNIRVNIKPKLDSTPAIINSYKVNCPESKIALNKVSN